MMSASSSAERLPIPAATGNRGGRGRYARIHQQDASAHDGLGLDPASEQFRGKR
jgi:hypothetical protein